MATFAFYDDAAGSPGAPLTDLPLITVDAGTSATPEEFWLVNDSGGPTAGWQLVAVGRVLGSGDPLTQNALERLALGQLELTLVDTQGAPDVELGGPQTMGGESFLPVPELPAGGALKYSFRPIAPGGALAQAGDVQLLVQQFEVAPLPPGAGAITGGGVVLLSITAPPIVICKSAVPSASVPPDKFFQCPGIGCTWRGLTWQGLPPQTVEFDLLDRDAVAVPDGEEYLATVWATTTGIWVTKGLKGAPATDQPLEPVGAVGPSPVADVLVTATAGLPVLTVVEDRLPPAITGGLIEGGVMKFGFGGEYLLAQDLFVRKAQQSALAMPTGANETKIICLDSAGSFITDDFPTPLTSAPGPLALWQVGTDGGGDVEYLVRRFTSARQSQSVFFTFPDPLVVGAEVAEATPFAGNTATLPLSGEIILVATVAGTGVNPAHLCSLGVLIVDTEAALRGEPVTWVEMFPGTIGKPAGPGTAIVDTTPGDFPIPQGEPLHRPTSLAWDPPPDQFSPSPTPGLNPPNPGAPRLSPGETTSATSMPTHAFIPAGATLVAYIARLPSTAPQGLTLRLTVNPL